MTLSDDIAEAEQRAREAAERAWLMYEATPEKAKRAAAALTRYAAVCRLAGRWEQHRGECHGKCLQISGFRADLTKLMAEVQA